MLYPTNSADRRQQPCTTTIRSRRAHPRHVLDTAALNAYVPNNVGSKSHNELTWNHVVSVFTFFGLLMTALVSLCCWSHFQFIVERRRLAANTEVNSQHRRLALDDIVEVSGKYSDEEVNGKYTKSVAAPTWYTDKGDVTTYFYGGTECSPKVGNSIKYTLETPCPNCIKDKDYKGEKNKVPRTKCNNCGKTGKLYGEPATKGKSPDKEITVKRDANGWKTITDSMPHYVKKDCIIFYCAIQKKWHMCGPDGKVYYRVNGKQTKLPEEGWYSAPKKTEGKDTSRDNCSQKISYKGKK